LLARFRKTLDHAGFHWEKIMIEGFDQARKQKPGGFAPGTLCQSVCLRV
jgi:hypothetical protein